jgi:hypothetical protein
MEFSGTSAAAPFVASACALLLAANPTLSPDQIGSLLKLDAVSDSFTGITPNNTWGYGKLDIAPAINTVSIPLATGNSARALPDGNPITLLGKIVTSVSSSQGYFHIEEDDRSSGIRVIGTGVAEGDRISILGSMTTSIERAVQAQRIDILQHNQTLPRPMIVISRYVGGPLAGCLDVDTSGLLITVYGRVSEGNSDYFLVKDTPRSKVRISTININPPSTGSLVFITGICSLMSDQAKIYPIILPRRQSDVIVLQ